MYILLQKLDALLRPGLCKKQWAENTLAIVALCRTGELSLTPIVFEIKTPQRPITMSIFAVVRGNVVTDTTVYISISFSGLDFSWIGQDVTDAEKAQIIELFTD